MRSIIAILVFCFAALHVFATAVKTNKNQVTTEFSDHISNKAELDSNIEEIKTEATSSLGGGAMSEVFKPNESGVSNLKSIDEYSLESRGRSERYSEENTYFDEFETDYTRPGAMAHKADVDKIINKTEEKLAKLTEVLRKQGIDCKEFAKNDEIKDPYYIDIEQTEHKEVEYDPHFCEYLRNTYNCYDTLTIHCEKPGMKWEPWQDKTIDFSPDEIMGNGWSYTIKWKRKRFGLHLKNDPHTAHSIRAAIARRHNVDIEHISPDLSIDGRGRNPWRAPTHWVSHKTYAFDRYTVGYKFREGEKICEKWGPEIWSETCNLISK